MSNVSNYLQNLIFLEAQKHPQKLNKIISNMPYRVCLDLYAKQTSKFLQLNEILTSYSCRNALLHLRPGIITFAGSITLWKDVIILMVDYYKFSDCCACGSNRVMEVLITTRLNKVHT